MKKKNIIKICILLSLIFGMILDYVFNVYFVELLMIILDLLFVRMYEKKTGEVIYTKLSDKFFSVLIIILLLILLLMLLYMLYVLFL